MRTLDLVLTFSVPDDGTRTAAALCNRVQQIAEAAQLPPLVSVRPLTPRLDVGAVAAIMDRLHSLTSATAEAVVGAREELLSLQGDGARIRMAGAAEREAILEVLHKRSGFETVEEMPDCAVYVRDNYISDGPGYFGPVAIVHWGGGPGFVNALVFRDGAWAVEEATP